jgi:hypothetical protein
MADRAAALIQRLSMPSRVLCIGGGDGQLCGKRSPADTPIPSRA